MRKPVCDTLRARTARATKTKALPTHAKTAMKAITPLMPLFVAVKCCKVARLHGSDGTGSHSPGSQETSMSDLLT